ncbi:MAG: cysteine--tRNA ligase [Anaerolineales bacterium]|nr:cysteine--tRNA ligase [Anaerolineales bacterium]
MGLMIYNTLSRAKEPFETLESDVVRMYVCGPTVYDKAHVGHAMSSIVFDVIRRYLEYRGYQVHHVMNYTDVEDKVILRANELGVEPMALAEKYLREYDQHLEDLNVLPALVNPRASTEIDTIIQMVKGLTERGYAYEVNGDVYFRVAKDEDYGKLSRRKVEDMRAGARLEVDKRKEDAADFALWKAAKPGEPQWESPWGPGRPGWHIECSAMTHQHLGDQIDIHGGGNDLIFPHHENEIAQSEAFTGKPFARYWVHNGMMQFIGEKMSKSIGNVVTVEAFLEEHPGDVLRMMVLNAGYRKPLTYTDDVVEQAASAIERLQSALRPANPTSDSPPDVAAALQNQIDETIAGFESAMDDDFNTSAAMSHLFELVRAINQARDAGISVALLTGAQDELRRLAGVLGLRLEEIADVQQEAAAFIDLLIDVRLALRNAKQYELADMIRDRLSALGITLEDGKEGTTWRSR